MKRFLLTCLSILLVVLLSLPVLAAETADLVRAFVYGDTLYTYVELTDVDRPITKADATLGSQVFPASGKLETVRQAGSPVTYLLLVDCSNSMPDYAADVTSFASELARTAGENTRFTLATFGTDFTVLGEDLSAEQLTEQIGTIAYTATQTRLHRSLEEMLDYWEALPRQGSELRSAVVLSDAVQYDPQGGVSYEEILSRISGSDVMVHSVGFGSDTEALETLSHLVETSGGIHAVVGPSLTAQAAAEHLTDYTNGLLVTGFPIGSYTGSGTESLSITFGSGAELICRAETEVEIPESLASGSDKTPGEKPVLPPSDAVFSGGATSVNTAPQETEAAGGGALPVTTAVIGVVVVLAALLAAVLLRRKKRASAPQAPAGIYMRLEVLDGTLTSSRTEFNLADELVVGRDAGCDIAFDSPVLSRRHTRIFWDGSAVRIQDLGSQNGTAVNGAAVTEPCILRSGDEITAGDVRFRLKF